VFQHKIVVHVCYQEPHQGHATLKKIHLNPWHDNCLKKRRVDVIKDNHQTVDIHNVVLVVFSLTYLIINLHIVMPKRIHGYNEKNGKP
jgi:hypothetical protein